MQPSVIFHWSTPKGFDNPHAKKKLLARWNLTCKAFGITTLCCVTGELLEMRDAEVTFKVAATLKEALDAAGENVVYVEQGGTSLKEFVHPENAVYVFGSDYGGLEVEGAVSIDSILPLHAEVAAGIVLAHRYLQWP